MRDFNEFLIDNDKALLNEIFGFGKPKPAWNDFLKNLSQTDEGPIASMLLKMFNKGVDDADYKWVKDNVNGLWDFFQKHRGELTRSGVNVDGLIQKFGLYDPKAYHASGKRFSNDYEMRRENRHG